jgi:hypothetical protein
MSNINMIRFILALYATVGSIPQDEINIIMDCTHDINKENMRLAINAAYRECSEYATLPDHGDFSLTEPWYNVLDEVSFDDLVLSFADDFNETYADVEVY